MYSLRILLPALLLCFNLAAQEAIPEKYVPFEPKRVRVDTVQEAVINAAWDALPVGKRVRLTTLSPAENKLKNADRMVLSQKRCQYIMKYLQQLDIPVTSYAVLIDPFDKKKKAPVSEMTNAGYRTMTSAGQGIYTVVLYREGYEGIPFTGSDTMDYEFTSCQDMKLNITAGGQLIGMQGTVIIFPPSALVYENGDKAECDVADICLREFYEKGDILAAGLTTHSGRRMLQSGGMIYLQATCKGKKLRLVSGKTIKVQFPTNGAKKEKGMHTFYGRHQDNLTNWVPSIREEGKTQDKPKPKPEVMIAPIDGEGDSEIEYEGEEEQMYADKSEAYFMESSRLGWINCDRFYEIPEKTDLFVKADSAMKPSVRLVFADIKSVVPGYKYGKDYTVKFDDMPKGKVATVVVFVTKGDQIYLGMEEVTLGKVTNLDIAMRPVSKDEFRREISALN